MRKPEIKSECSGNRNLSLSDAKPAEAQTRKVEALTYCLNSNRETQMHLNAHAETALLAELTTGPKMSRQVKRHKLLSAIRTEGASSILRLLFATQGAPRLTVDEVIYFDLLRRRVPIADIACYVGKRRQRVLHAKVNDPTCLASCHNKQRFYQQMRLSGFPAPTSVAHCAPYDQVNSDSFTTYDTFVEHLRLQCHFPLFLKPIYGIFSVGAQMLKGFSDEQFILSHSSVSKREFIHYLSVISAHGYLAQEVMVPSAYTKQCFSNSLCTIRFLVLADSQGGGVESAFLKIPAHSAIADNYWRVGNLIVGIEPTSGTLTRAISGSEATLVQHEEIPNTGLRVQGHQIAGWSNVVASVLEWSRVFPGIRTQSWDVALTQDGPVALDLNFGGDLNLHQLVHERGILSENYFAHAFS